MMAQEKKVIEFSQERLVEVSERVRFRRTLFSCFIVLVILVTVYIATPLSRLGVIYFDGLDALSRSDMIALIDIEGNDFFFGIRLSEIQQNIEAHPVVSQVEVSRVWFNRLRITIVEYEVGACALIASEVHHILIDGTVLHEDDGLR